MGFGAQHWSCVNITRRSRCNSSSSCFDRDRGHVDPTWSRKIRCGGDSFRKKKKRAGKPAKWTFRTQGSSELATRTQERMKMNCCACPEREIPHGEGQMSRKGVGNIKKGREKGVIIGHVLQQTYRMKRLWSYSKYQISYQVCVRALTII